MTSRRTSSSRPGDGRGRSRARPSAAPSSATTRANRTTSRAATTPDDQPPEPTRSKLTGRAAVLLLVLAVLAVSYASSTRAWLRQRSDVDDLTAQIKTSQAQIDQLEQEKRRWADPAYIKAQARLRFGWVMPGETGYRVIGDDGQTLSDGTSQLAEPDAPTAADQPQWWDTAWGSVVAAGGEPDQPEDSTPTRQPITRIGGGSGSSSGR